MFTNGYRSWTILILTIVCLAGVGCSSAYYGTMERLGVHKRELLVKRVVATQEDQEEAKEQFRSALDAFREVVEVQPSELQDRYDNLNRELERSEEVAGNVTDRIESVEDVADALFREWEQELTQYSSDDLRRKSERQLWDTRQRYDQLLNAMRRAESKMDPVLSLFRDQVLYLKHNLNAQAIASLQNEVFAVESEVEALIREMEIAIEEANSFIQTLETA